MARLELVRGDITEQDVDAIVNAANEALLPGAGVCGAIHRRGGPMVAEACAALGGCATGDARVTTAGDLPARMVVHAVGPIWHDGGRGEDGLLASAHRRAVEEAGRAGARSIAFPALSTGIYGFPVERAARIAVPAALAAAEEAGLDTVRFVLFSDDDLRTFEAARDAPTEGEART